MIKINFSLGRWQLVCATEVMSNSWKMVKKYKCSLSEALKLEWNKVKKLVKELSSSYKEYKYKLVVEGINYILKFKADNLDKVIDSCMKKIEKTKGKNFISEFKKDFRDNHDQNLKIFKKRKAFTFADNVFVVRLNE